MIEWTKPQVLEASEIVAFLAAHPAVRKIDEIKYAISELFDIRHPAKKDTKTTDEVAAFGQELTGNNSDTWGNWFYFSWNNYLIHFPPKAELRALRTSRNRNLITSHEQAKLYDSTILIGGMSVGSNVVEALISSGIGGKLIIADMDIIEPSNLNRIRASYQDVGVHKVEAIAKKVSEIDPYIEQIHLKDGLNKTNLKQVVEQHKPDILVDEVDDLATKIAIRQLAKEHKLPVVMATDNGDDFILDIERYDTEDISIFNGRIPQDIIDRILSGEDIPRAELGMVIGKYFVGMENISKAMMGSLQEVGKTIPSWPQLGSSAALSGIYVAAYIRYILTTKISKSLRILAGPSTYLK
jgi:molybdopterin/thiamine biosynthesis adenylyltransferase